MPLGDADYCSLCGPCAAGEGDCDAGQCRPGLSCIQNVGGNYGFAPGTDVCEAAPLVIQLTPTADAYVAEASPSSSFGSGQELRVRFNGSGKTHYSFLRFEVPSLPGPILAAKLRLRTQETAIAEAGFYDADLAPWAESTITWNNWETPPSHATYLRSMTDLAPNTWHEVDVSEAVTGGGSITIGIASSGDAADQDFWSRESAWDPVLVVSYLP